MTCPLCFKEFRENGCNHTLLQISEYAERMETLEFLKDILEPWIKGLIRKEISKNE